MSSGGRPGAVDHDDPAVQQRLTEQREAYYARAVPHAVQDRYAIELYSSNRAFGPPSLLHQKRGAFLGSTGLGFWWGLGKGANGEDLR